MINAPTDSQIAALVAQGWGHWRDDDGDDWFWPPDEIGGGWTYSEAVSEQRRREDAQERTP
jgi:hypothetical protein